jgi:hypothetical protein
MKSKNLSKQCAKSRTLNNEIKTETKPFHNYVIVVPEFTRTDTFIFRMMALFGSPLELSPSSPKRRKETLNWELSIVDISCKIREYTSSLLISFDLTKLSVPTSRTQITGSALEHSHIMHCSQRKYTSKQNCSVFKTDQIFFYKYWTSFNYVYHHFDSMRTPSTCSHAHRMQFMYFKIFLECFILTN